MVLALLKIFGWGMASSFVIKLVFMAFSMISPLLVFEFTEFIEKDDSVVLENKDYYKAILIACAIICLQLVEHFGHALFDKQLHEMSNLAIKSLKVMIFNKSFRMGSAGRRNYTFAQVLNMVDSAP